MCLVSNIVGDLKFKFKIKIQNLLYCFNCYKYLNKTIASRIRNINMKYQNKNLVFKGAALNWVIGKELKLSFQANIIIRSKE